MRNSFKKNKVNASLHIFSHGQHKIALPNNPGSTQYWPAMFEEWLKEIEILK